MNTCVLEEATLKQLAEEIAQIKPLPHHANLLTAVNRHLTGCAFQFALTQEDWYRLGGIIRADGLRVTDDLENWAETELTRCDDDVGVLIDRHFQDDFFATRLVGKMHYFVARYGSAPADFLQLEIEELQEVLDRHLIDRENPPTDLSEFIDPISPQTLPFQAVSRPRYHLHQLTDIRPAIARLTGPDEPLAPTQRLLKEWVASRAGAHNHFSQHWIITLREHTDCYRQTVMTATPLSLHARKLRYFHWDIEKHGAELANQLADFDRVAGYPFAWYFHLVAGSLTPHYVALKVKQDLETGYSYLAKPDWVVLESWLKSPYTI